MSSIDREHAEPLAETPATGGMTLDGSDLHVLRLCLDLQLDALLLTVGAASSVTEAPEAPWVRWVNEDVQLACSLATDARTAGAGPPSGLGSDLDRDVLSVTENGLHARYTSMATLLSGLIERPRREGEGQDEQPHNWRYRAERALWQCRERLAELEAHPWRQLASMATEEPADEHRYLPGELLG